MYGNDQPDLSKRMSPGETFNLMYFLADCHATALTPFLRRGFGINANSWNGFGAMLLLLLWWGADPHDELMAVYFGLWIVALLFHKGYTLKLLRQGNKIHSRYGGDPWLAMKIPFVRKPATARALEPTMCFVIGIALCPVSPALGVLWMAGFISLSVREAIDYLAVKARMQVMDDAEIEGRFYSQLRQHRDEDW